MNPNLYNEVIANFWDVFPFVWYQTRHHIRGVAVERYKLTVEQFQILRRIRNGSTSVSALAATSQTSRSSVSKVVDGLVNRDYISRGRDISDRRNIPLELTEQGQKVLGDVYAETEQWLLNHFASLSDNELRDISHALGMIHGLFNTPLTGK